MSDIDRRHFIRVAGRAVPIFVGVPLVVGCSSSTEPVEDSDDMVIVSVSSLNAGHSHSAELPENDLDSAQPKSYGSSSSGGHTHTVTFSEDDFATLRATGQVTIQSSSDSGHAHSFTFRT